MKKLTPPTVSIHDTMPGAGRRRYVRLDSHPGDPDPSGATQGIALQDPDLLDSIVKDMQISAERKRCLQQYLGTGMPRYVRWLRQPAFDPMRHRIVQTGFTS